MGQPDMGRSDMARTDIWRSITGSSAVSQRVVANRRGLTLRRWASPTGGFRSEVVATGNDRQGLGLPTGG
jgi:hypothetical protein